MKPVRPGLLSCIDSSCHCWIPCWWRNGASMVWTCDQKSKELKKSKKRFFNRAWKRTAIIGQKPRQTHEVGTNQKDSKKRGQWQSIGSISAEVAWNSWLWNSCDVKCSKGKEFLTKWQKGSEKVKGRQLLWLKVSSSDVEALIMASIVGAESESKR